MIIVLGLYIQVYTGLFEIANGRERERWKLVGLESQ